MKKTIISIVIVILVILSPIIYIVLAWGFIGLSAAVTELFAFALPKPKITHSEFPFSITYEINGEEHTVEDTYVCEFVKNVNSFEVGAYRVWDGYVKSTGEEAVIVYEDSDITIFCDVGSPAYYMNDEENHYEDGSVEPRLYRALKENTDYDILEKPLEDYNIALIDWHFSEPIENSFGYFYFKSK